MSNNNDDWRTAAAPTLGDIEALAQEAWNRLPAQFRALAGNIVLRVEDFASEEVLEELDIDDAFELTGLYQGVSLDRKSVSDGTREPDLVFIFRRAILDEWVASGEELGHLVTHVLIHEIGHHFGFSDEDMDAIEADIAA
jgi:predicted Zn-dependent protease with MMP-like domain